MMICHICMPDSHVFEIEVDPKATGQLCLDKVSDCLAGGLWFVVLKKK